MSLRSLLSVASLLLAAFSASLAAAADSAAEAPPVQRKLTLARLQGQASIPLRTTEGKYTITFGTRADEVVTRAVLRLRYTYSPSLIAAESHIKVLLNDESVGVIPFTKENAGKTVSFELDIDPRFIGDFNRLTLQFIGHYTHDCEDPLHSSLWADVSGTSELELTSRPLALPNELGSLPEPFFDKRDLNHVNLPFVFAAKPSHASLQAGGVLAGWFGKLAAWRGARFPAHLDSLPKGHAVVFATDRERPSFLGPEFKIGGPGLAVLTNPADGFSKLLVVSGRDAKEMQAAAEALALGSGAISGASAQVARPPAQSLRAAYDAPNWVRLDRPTKFGELVASPLELQSFGHVPEPIRINMRIPPDLFTWRSRGVPVDLKFRYTPPIRASESRLTMSINEELVQSFNLRSSGQGGDAAHVVLPLLDSSLLGESKEVFVPAFKLGARNQLQYGFSFAYQKEGHCRDTAVENVRAMIDADSRIDFSGYPHYAEMPHIGYFATAGFPFTKYADLAQTVIVLPDAPAPADIEVMLTLLGRLGESTGYPGTRFLVTGAADTAAMQGKDLLVIGAAPHQGLLKRWGDKLPALVSGEQRRISQPKRAASFLFDWLGFGLEPEPAVATQAEIKSSGHLAAILGFENPLSSERSVLAVTAVAAEDMRQVLDALDDENLAKAMKGSAVFVAGKRIESVLAGPTYTIGVLPFWTAIWFPLSSHPILLALTSVLAVLVFAFALWRTLKAIAARRLRERD